MLAWGKPKQFSICLTIMCLFLSGLRQSSRILYQDNNPVGRYFEIKTGNMMVWNIRDTWKFSGDSWKRCVHKAGNNTEWLKCCEASAYSPPSSENFKPPYFAIPIQSQISSSRTFRKCEWASGLVQGWKYVCEVIIMSSFHESPWRFLPSEHLPRSLPQ